MEFKEFTDYEKENIDIIIGANTIPNKPQKTSDEIDQLEDVLGEDLSQPVSDEDKKLEEIRRKREILSSIKGASDFTVPNKTDAWHQKPTTNDGTVVINEFGEIIRETPSK